MSNARRPAPAACSWPLVIERGLRAPFSLQRRRSGVVVEQPVVALRHPRAGPLALHVAARLRRIGKRGVMEALDVVGGALDRAPRALAPRTLIPLQGFGSRKLLQAAGKDIAVLDRHDRALREEWQHRVAGVA